MQSFKADLHIHTVLSPCGDLEMSPTNIIAKAKELGLDCIGITDHNCTLHTKLAKRLGREQGVFVLMQQSLSDPFSSLKSLIGYNYYK